MDDYIKRHADRYAKANAAQNRKLAVDSLWRIASYLDWEVSEDGEMSTAEVYRVLNYLCDNGCL